MSTSGIATLSLGYSTCPNDTYIFHALAAGIVAAPGYRFEPYLADVEELNARAARGELDVCKVSVGAVAGLLDEYQLLRAGGAMGRGVGPVLVSAGPLDPKELDGATIAIPGEMTTANLLLGLYLRELGIDARREPMVFDQVMDAVSGGRARAGVLIHEGRFTFAGHGLSRVADLGAWWEEFSGLPIPLGCIAIRRGLGPDAARTVNAAIRQSLEHANANPAAGRTYIKQHAQEMDDRVIDQHIATFVTDYSLDAGEEGERAVAALLDEARRLRGIAAPSGSVFISG